MPSIRLHSLFDGDRSGKIRWTANELGIEVEEVRVRPPAHRQRPFLDLSPLGVVPVVEFEGQVLRDSTAICQLLAETVSAPELTIAPGDPRRADYLTWIHSVTSDFESKLVECAISKAGMLPPEVFTGHERLMRRRLAVLTDLLPAQGHLCGDRFTLADIHTGYSVRLAVQTGLLDRADVEPWMSRVAERPAARASRCFHGI